jgi:hypothetical protein
MRYPARVRKPGISQGSVLKPVPYLRTTGFDSTRDRIGCSAVLTTALFHGGHGRRRGGL